MSRSKSWPASVFLRLQPFSYGPVGRLSSECSNRVAAFMTNYTGCTVCVWLCVSQAATDDPHIHDHQRGNAEYNQVLHFVISLLIDDETGVSAPDTTSGLTHPGHGCPQRSQLQPTCASISRTGNSSNVTSFNISLVVSASSLNKRVGFIESLRMRSKLPRSLVP